VYWTYQTPYAGKRRNKTSQFAVGYPKIPYSLCPPPNRARYNVRPGCALGRREARPRSCSTTSIAISCPSSPGV
jgi:hypothetical protein